MHIIFELEAFDTRFTPCIHVSRSIGKGMNADGLSLTLALKEFDSHDFKVTDYEIKTLEFNIDPKTELRLLSILELGKVENK